MFIGREKELFEMDQLYQQDKFHCFILYGRRRVGKTTLLKEFCKGKDHIFYSAEQSNDKNNLQKFSETIFFHYGEEDISPFSDWGHAFSYIEKKQGEGQLVLVMDEFPYLAEINPSILSKLQHLIDHKLQESKLFLVLCGSYMGFMEREVLGAKSPLFGRRTAQMRLKPFDYFTSAKFLEGFGREEQLILYGAFGGTAMYLRQVLADQSVKENIMDIILKPSGYLYEEPILLLKQEVQQPGVYSAIIEAIALGAVRASEIAAKTGEDSAKCMKYTGMLRELGIVVRELPFGEKENSKKSLYQLSDNMFRFWYRYVFPNKSLLETDAQNLVWEKKIQNDLSDYMGYVFEKVCQDYMLRKNSLGKLPVLFTKIGRWWGNDRQKKCQVEIDLIAGDGKEFIFCECKWRNERLDLGVLDTLRDKAAVYLRQCAPSDGKKFYMLFSKGGFTKAVVEEAKKNGDIFLVGLEELF